MFEDRLEGAKTYAKLSKDEFPIYIYDCAAWGVSSTSGVTATNKAIHFRGTYSSSTDPGEIIYWNAISSFENAIIKTKNKTYKIPFPGCVDANELPNLKMHHEILYQMWNDFK
jgi:hypothetical protein